MQGLDPLGRSSKPRNKNLSSEEFKEDTTPKSYTEQKKITVFFGYYCIKLKVRMLWHCGGGWVGSGDDDGVRGT